MIFNLLILIFIGTLPSVLWLLFFLRKDVHPEPNSMVLKVFFGGILATVPVAIFELSLFYFLSLSTYFFLLAAFIEEIAKFLVIKFLVLKSPELDEPTDIILYMIISALGFAALENIFQIRRLSPLSKVLIVSFLRFWGAIFLHALCSALLGYFLALSFYSPAKKMKNILVGIFSASLLHFLYNFFIIQIDKNFVFLFLAAILLLWLAIFISLSFKRLQKLKSICKIQ